MRKFAHSFLQTSVQTRVDRANTKMRILRDFCAYISGPKVNIGEVKKDADECIVVGEVKKDADECIVIRKSCVNELYVYRHPENREWCLGLLDDRTVSVKLLGKVSHWGLMACHMYRRLKTMKEHPAIPIIFDVSEDQKYWYFVTQQLNCTLLDLVYLRHPRFSTSHEWRDVRLDKVLRSTRFWDDKHRPLFPAFSLIKDILLGVVYLNSQKLAHQNITLDNMLVYAIQDQVCGRIWPLEALVQDDSFERHVLNQLGCSFFEFLTGGVEYQGPGDLAMISHFPDALDFIRLLIDGEAPTLLNKIVQHPCMWDESLHMEFIVSVSSCFNFKDLSEADHESVKELLAKLDFDVLNGRSWGDSLPRATQDQLKRRYDFFRIDDLVRLMRNMHSHPEDVFLQGISDENGERLYVAVRKKFPNFLSALYNLATDAAFPKQFSSIITKRLKVIKGKVEEAEPRT